MVSVTPLAFEYVTVFCDTFEIVNLPLFPALVNPAILIVSPGAGTNSHPLEVMVLTVRTCTKTKFPTAFDTFEKG